MSEYCYESNHHDYSNHAFNFSLFQESVTFCSCLCYTLNDVVSGELESSSDAWICLAGACQELIREPVSSLALRKDVLWF